MGVIFFSKHGKQYQRCASCVRPFAPPLRRHPNTENAYCQKSPQNIFTAVGVMADPFSFIFEALDFTGRLLLCVSTLFTILR